MSGIIETSYRIAQLSVKLDRSLLAGDSPELHDMLTTVFDGARDDIERGIRAGLIDLSEEADPLRRIILAKGMAHLSPARATELHARLEALLREFGDEPPDVEADSYGFVLSVYPLTGATAEDPTLDASDD